MGPLYAPYYADYEPLFQEAQDSAEKLFANKLLGIRGACDGIGLAAPVPGRSTLQGENDMLLKGLAAPVYGRLADFNMGFSFTYVNIKALFAYYRHILCLPIGLEAEGAL